MKRTFPFLLILFFFICTISEVISQDLSDVPINLEPLWSTQSNISAGRLGWYDLTAMGTLVVTSDTPSDEASASGSNSGASKISGYNPDTGALIFQNGRPKGPNTSYSDVINKKGIRASVNVGLANTILNNRFEASKQGKDYYYIFAKLGKADDKGGGVVKLNKDTGEAILAVPFGYDKSPDFIVDEDSGRLFYFKMKKDDDFNGGGNSMMGRAIEILCYQL